MAEKIVLTQKVTEEMLAVNVGSGSLRVLATPSLCALFEKAAAQLAQQLLPPEKTTVGCSLEVEHTAPTPLGATVTVTAELLEQKGRRFVFHLRAQDNEGECGTATHTRVAVDSAHFQQKADARCQ